MKLYLTNLKRGWSFGAGPFVCIMGDCKMVQFIVGFIAGVVAICAIALVVTGSDRKF